MVALRARRCVTTEISARNSRRNSLPTRERLADLACRELHPKESAVSHPSCPCRSFCWSAENDEASGEPRSPSRPVSPQGWLRQLLSAAGWAPLLKTSAWVRSCVVGVVPRGGVCDLRRSPGRFPGRVRRRTEKPWAGGPFAPSLAGPVSQRDGRRAPTNISAPSAIEPRRASLAKIRALSAVADDWVGPVLI